MTRILLVLGLLLPAAGAASAAEAPGAGHVVLDTAGLWRCHFAWGPCASPDANAERRARQEKAREGLRDSMAWRQPPLEPPIGSLSVETPPAPDGWAAVEFDDGGWSRGRGPFPSPDAQFWPRTLRAITLRGRFWVADPERAGPLALSAEYGGGIVACVNGREVARAHLPTGPLGADTPADPYRAEAYASRPVPANDPANRFARRLEGATVPASALRAGVNVLAIQVRKASDPPDMTDRRGLSRNEVRLGLVALRATSAEPFAPPATGRRPWRVYNAHALEAIGAAWDLADPLEPLPSVRLVAPRGGAASGQVVVAGDVPLVGLRAKAGPLVQADGGAALPAAAVRIRFAAPQELRVRIGIAAGAESRFDALLDAATTEEKRLQPVWLTVEPPRDAAPGAYAGTLVIEADGAPPVTLPISLTVCPWAAPRPRDSALYLGIFQSPDSLALRYGVKPWSPEHVRLMDRSLELLGALGNDLVLVPLLVGVAANEETMVRRVKGREGAAAWDFAPLEAYLDLVAARLGTGTTLCLYAWDPRHSARPRYGRKETPTVPVTEIDPAGGEAHTLGAPKFGDPGSEAFWRPVFEGVRERAVSRGWAEGALLIALATDSRPTKAHAESLKRLAPYARWAVHTHQNPRTPLDFYGTAVEHSATALCDLPEAGGKQRGWDAPWQRTLFPRNLFNDPSLRRPWLSMRAPPGLYRTVPEMSLAAGYRGIARVGADFWDLVPGTDGRSRSLLELRPSGDSTLAVTVSAHHLLAPAPDGPVATARYEMLREGIQEAEARVFIGKALADKATRKRLGDALAARCRATLDARVGLYLTACEASWTGFEGWGEWDRRAATLYALAGAVAKALEAR